MRNIFAAVLFSFTSVFAQDWDSIRVSLQHKIDTVHNANGDGAKEFLNEELSDFVLEMAQVNGFWQQQFKGLNFMYIGESPDKAFRMVSWNYVNQMDEPVYNCIFILNEKKKGAYITYRCEDKSYLYPPRYEDGHTPDAWYPALYYEIIPCKTKTDVNYVLLAYNNSNQCSNMKFLESLSISKGKISFGERIFQVKDEKTGRRRTAKRAFIEYKKEAYASLKFHEEENRIVFDHCVPENGSLQGIYCHYSPSFSLDAYTWCDDQEIWVLHEDVVQTSDEGDEVAHSPLDPNNPNGVSPYKRQKTSKLDPCIPFGTQTNEDLGEIKVKRKKLKKSKTESKRYLDKKNRSSILSD